MKNLLTISLLIILLIGCKKEETPKDSVTYPDITEIESNVVYYANKDYSIWVTNSGCHNFELRSDETDNPNYVIFEQIGGESYFWEKELNVTEGNYFIFDGCDNMNYRIL